MGFWKTVFNKKDGTIARVQLAVSESAARREVAASKLEMTIRELLETNDKVTGRAATNEKVSK